MSAFLRAAGRALAAHTALTPTQAKGTLRLLLKERGVDPKNADRAAWLAVLDQPLREALAKRHVELTDRAVGAVRRAVEEARDADEDALGFFSDFDD